MKKPNRRFIHVFGGIDALGVAKPDWEPIAFSEIEPFACAVLAHHHPSVPNLGDITKIDFTQFAGSADIFSGGSPCQSFSVAGLRKSLQDTRGNLTLEYIRGFNESECPVGLWENVPGVLSTDDNAFGLFVAGMVGESTMLFPDDKQAERWLESEFINTILHCYLALADFRYFRTYRRRYPKSKWGNAGMVFGPKGSFAWRILDAQYFALPQRRERVFGVAFRPRNAHRLFNAPPREDLARFLGLPGAILFEPGSLPRNTPSRSKTRQKATATPARGTGRKSEDALRGNDGREIGKCSERCETNRAVEGATSVCYESIGYNAIDVLPTLDARCKDGLIRNQQAPFVCFQQNTRDEVRLTDGDRQIAGTLTANPGAKQQNYLAFSYKDYGDDAGIISPTLRSAGFTNSHANSGAPPAVVIKIDHTRSNGWGVLDDGTSHTLGGSTNAVAYAKSDVSEELATPTCYHFTFCDANDTRKDRVNGGLYVNETDKSNSLTAGNPSYGTVICSKDTSNANEEKRSGCLTPWDYQRVRIHSDNDLAPCLFNNGKGGGNEAPSVFSSNILRRFSPTECLRLQGFPDGYLNITYRGKPAFNGPKYRAVGNSWAVTVARWVGDRVDLILDALDFNRTQAELSPHASITPTEVPTDFLQTEASALSNAAITECSIDSLHSELTLNSPIIHDFITPVIGTEKGIGFQALGTTKLDNQGSCQPSVWRREKASTLGTEPFATACNRGQNLSRHERALDAGQEAATPLIQDECIPYSLCTRPVLALYSALPQLVSDECSDALLTANSPPIQPECRPSTALIHPIQPKCRPSTALTHPIPPKENKMVASPIASAAAKPITLVVSKQADEQYTPNTEEQPVVRLVVEALGGTIDVDVTADRAHSIPAQHHITQEDNYLTTRFEGAGTAFMNPPYSCPLPFVQKLCDDFASGYITRAIALLKAGTAHNQGTGALIKEHASAQCQWGVHTGRIGFIKDGIQRKGADFDCTLYYFGDDWQKFKEVFDPWGLVSFLPKAQSQLVPISAYPEQPQPEMYTIAHQNDEDLSYDEQRDRLHLERQVEHGLYEAGKALKDLRDRKLYRSTHTNFESYCLDRFGFGRQNAYKKIDAFDVYKVLYTNSVQILPASIEQAAALAHKDLSDEQKVEVWKGLTQDGKRPSGKKVKGAVAEICDRLAARGDYRNPWRIGDICQIHKKGDGSLAKYDGSWAIVSDVKERQCLVSVWNGSVLVKAENLEPLELGDEFKKVCDRVRSLLSRHLDGDITLKRGQLRFLEALGEQVEPFETEDIEMLAFIEAKLRNLS